MNPKFYTQTGKGLTSTKAAFVCDSIKNLLMPIETQINGMVFYNTSTSIITNPSEKTVTSIGVATVEGVKDNLELIGQLYGLSAWLREAVKQKDEELKNLLVLNLSEWAEKEGITIPTSPSHDGICTEADIIASWEPAKIARYYLLEAKSAHYGKAINPDGSIYKANQALQKVVVCPNTTSGEGQDMLIRSFEPSIDPAIVGAFVEDLRQTKGSYESELNSMKSEIKRETDRINLERNNARQMKLNEYHAQLQEVNSKFNNWKIEEQARLSALKIVIPENLQPAMDWLKAHQQETAAE